MVRSLTAAERASKDELIYSTPPALSILYARSCTARWRPHDEPAPACRGSIPLRAAAGSVFGWREGGWPCIPDRRFGNRPSDFPDHARDGGREATAGRVAGS